jgi:hypothetical protein
MPNSQGQASWKRPLRLSIVVASLVVGLLFEQCVLATTFSAGDDEGYMLLSFGRYLSGKHLYTEVFSQYGPFYFFTQAVIFRLLSLPVNHDAGRMVTLIFWLLSAIFAGFFVYRMTKNTILSVAAGLSSMVLGRVLASEPGHPEQLILLILILACCASISSGPVGPLLLGALGAALVFTKINVGVFFFAALALTFVCRLPSGWIKTVGAGSMLVYFASAPFVLMHRDILGWARGYGLLAALCGVSTLIVGLLTTPPARKPSRTALYTLIGGMSVTIFIAIGTTEQGMSLRTLLDGVLWGPLKHPGVFEKPLRVSNWTTILGFFALGGIAALNWWRMRQPTRADWVGACRAIVGLGIICRLMSHQLQAIDTLSLPFLTIFLPLGLIPTGKGFAKTSEYFPRLFVTSLAATQLLQPYPVAGSQLNIAEAPLLLWAFLCVHDGAHELLRLVQRLAGWSGAFLSPASIFGGLVILAAAIPIHGDRAWHERYSNSASSLPGSNSLHLPKELDGTFQFVADNVRANCEVLFTLPGMASFNLWSGVPPPNGLNLTAWMKGFNLGQQQQILEILKINQHACVVYNAKIAGDWETTKRDLDALPLARYILYEMPRASQRGAYEIRISPQRHSPWIETYSAP